MGVGAVLYMCDVVKKFTFSISSPDEFLFMKHSVYVGPGARHRYAVDPASFEIIQLRLSVNREANFRKCYWLMQDIYFSKFCRTLQP